MPPTIALQIIQTSWTKKSRGGRGATLRNAVPRVFPCEAHAGRFKAKIRYFGEADDFAAPLPPSPRVQNDEVREMSESFTYTWSNISCLWEQPGGNLLLRWSNSQGGAPSPIFCDEFGNEKPLRRDTPVAVNTWGRWRWMERFSDYDTGQWWYQHTVVNLAHFGGPIDPNVFVQTLPASEFSFLPILR